jgi:hypothetical protein
MLPIAAHLLRNAAQVLPSAAHLLQVFSVPPA